MAYLLDADVFIQAKNLHYGLDFCPAFWEWLQAKHNDGSVNSVEKVGDEIEAGDDELSEWALPFPRRLLSGGGSACRWTYGGDTRTNL